MTDVFVYQQEMLKKMAHTIDKIDEDRYDAEAKVMKADKEVDCIVSCIFPHFETYIANLIFLLTFSPARLRT